MRQSESSGAGKRFLALDLGAESGRGVIGTLANGKLALEQVGRFRNGPVNLLGALHWDASSIHQHTKDIIAQSAAGGALDGIGVDTWGVDYGLIGSDGELLGNPYHYRDARTTGMSQHAFKLVPREEIFARTGIQFMEINTLYQLLATARAKSPALGAAHRLLMMPDLFHYWLTGEAVGEFTIATTSQCYDPRAGDWARGMLEKMGIPTDILPPLIQPGTVLGPLAKSVAEETETQAPVIAPASHDTGSAVAAVPANGDDWCYISSGTWSLMGVEVAAPVINDAALRYNFTNEGGVAGTYRFLKNIGGLWLVQESRRTWEREGRALSYDELTSLAADAESLVSIVEPDHPSFLHPGDMPARIGEFCRETGQPEPDDVGAVIRCILESLALKYRWVLERLEEMLGRRIARVHIVGGGTQNTLLSQLAADALERPVMTGPVEATAIGNIMIQAIAVGEVGSLAEARAIVAASFPTTTYEPGSPDGWDEAYDRYCALLDGGP
ncbi:MAG: rhamnulokinase [Armatimonadota bacterium]|nr:MAG: rhamnulokinase [Armatimonadota bacterium]